MDVNVNDIITTNYDFSLEKSITANWLTKNIFGRNSEPKNRVHTCNIIGEKKVWHIHGDADNPKTIVLGHERYASVLGRFIEYLEKENTIESIRASNQIISWVDLIFKSNVHMVGFEFGYA